MSAAAVSVAAQRLPSPALRRFAWGVLAYFIAVILWGTLVRATGSGAGCGGHWPLCNGMVMQHSANIETLIEYTHRITSGLSLLAVVGLMAWTFLGTVRGHLARAAAVASVAFTVIEALLGALLVILGYTAESPAPLRPAFLALHLTNTLLLLAALTLTAHLLSRRKGYLRGSVRLAAPVGAIATVAVVMAVGVTGSLAALGDTLFPASSLGMALAQDFSSTSGWLVRWRWTHPGIAFAASFFLIWLLVRAARRNAHWDNRNLCALVLLLLAAVYALGLLDVILLAPLWVQVAHLLAADTLWAALVVLTARLTLVPIVAERKVWLNGADNMGNKVYFDTVSLRSVGRAFNSVELPNDLKDAIVVSPLSALEVMSQLTIAKADEVLCEIHAMSKWLNPLGAEILPWTDDVLAIIGFGMAVEPVDVAETIGVALRNCLGATSSSQLKTAAGELKDLLDKTKYMNAQSFEQLLNSVRGQPSTGDVFSEALFNGTAARVKADPKSLSAMVFAKRFSAFHEFERVKLNAALNSNNYNPYTKEHQNDLFDSEQLIYLGIPRLHFITCDRGFKRVERSEQASRIIVVSREDLSEAKRVEALLRGVIGQTGSKTTTS